MYIAASPCPSSVNCCFSCDKLCSKKTYLHRSDDCTQPVLLGVTTCLLRLVSPTRAMQKACASYCTPLALWPSVRSHPSHRTRAYPHSCAARTCSTTHRRRLARVHNQCSTVISFVAHAAAVPIVSTATIRAVILHIDLPEQVKSRLLCHPGSASRLCTSIAVRG